ncbi:hypothetical protein C8J56DRAFT_152843 [Mycena floridula]|nr:hypothetical protein C8J56DRAFT_152843 [Mycena floridula]
MSSTSTTSNNNLSANSTALFLGLDLGTDQLRASLLDADLNLVGVERVEFDDLGFGIWDPRRDLHDTGRVFLFHLSFRILLLRFHSLVLPFDFRFGLPFFDDSSFHFISRLDME